MTIKSALLTAIFALAAMVPAAQDFIEASGQTQAFTLAAGSKATWNQNPSSITIALPSSGVRPTIAFSSASGSATLLVDKCPVASVTLTVFDLCGRILVRQPIHTIHGSAQTPLKLRSGRYFVKLTTATASLVTRTITVAR
jgi:hypothetical protein